ncbi:hypothetical protein AMTRI_Chr13g86720 [Amborella trichopoda]
MLDTMAMKEPVSQGNVVRAKEEVQQKLPAGDQQVKKRKKIHDPSSSIEMQWTNFGAENTMRMARGAYNTFWSHVMAAIDGSPYLCSTPPFYCWDVTSKSF